MSSSSLDLSSTISNSSTKGKGKKVKKIKKSIKKIFKKSEKVDRAKKNDSNTRNGRASNKKSKKNKKSPESSVDIPSSISNDINIILLDDSDHSTNDDISNEKSESKVEDKTPESTDSVNGLADNEDFVAFDFSSDEDSDDSKKRRRSVSSEDEDDDEDYDPENLNQPKKPKLSLYPWIKDHDHSRQREISDWLSNEIEDFIAYMSPSRKEIEIRNDVVKRLKELVQRKWPDAKLHCFGSSATDLYLPGADIDMVVVSPSQKYTSKSHLYALSSVIKQSGVAKRVDVIAGARVPIIKFVEAQHNIPIDISFERLNGLEAAQTIRKWIKETPCMRELTLIVKQFLSARSMNEVHTGGLGGYSVICLVYSFLKLHPKLVTNTIRAEDNLGTLMIEFFELYGLNFGYDDTAIVIDDNGNCSYIPKHTNPDMVNPKQSFSLAIQDPNDSTNNISRSTFNIRNIKKAFGGAFDLLTSRCYELEYKTYKQRLNQSILGNIITFKGPKRDFKDERSTILNTAILSPTSMIDIPSLKSLPPSDFENSPKPIAPSVLQFQKDKQESIINKKISVTDQLVFTSDESDSDSADNSTNNGLTKTDQSVLEYKRKQKLINSSADPIVILSDPDDFKNPSDDDNYEPIFVPPSVDESKAVISKADRMKFWENKGRAI